MDSIGSMKMNTFIVCRLVEFFTHGKFLCAMKYRARSLARLLALFHPEVMGNISFDRGLAAFIK